MKTLIIANFPKEEDFSNFKKNFADELGRNDVIFIENPKDKTDLEGRLKSYQGEFDRVVVSAHGGQREIPTMTVGGDKVAITDVIKAVNKDNEETLKKIHLTSCFIGSNFDKIEQKDGSSRYYLELDESLRDGQILFLHGDSYTGDLRSSLDQRLKGVVENEDYRISEAVFDSAEAMSVVAKKYHNLDGSLLKTFSYQPFGRVGEEFTTTDLRPYLSGVVTKARDFEKAHGILNGNASEQRLENLSEEDLQQYLSERFIRKIVKAFDANHLEMVESLIKKINPNLANKNGFTALMFAADKGCTEIVKLLLENEKIDPNLADKYGWTALMYAADKGQTETAKLLLENEKTDPNLSNKDGFTALMFAADKGHIESAKLLLENEKTDQNLANKNGWTALMFAADKGHAETAKLLLENEKTDPNLASKSGFTALVFAADKGQTETAKLLLENEKTDPNLANKDGFTALMYAANKGDAEMVEYLIEKGADPEIKTPLGVAASYLAKGENKDKIIELLSQAIEKKHQDAILKKWESAFSSQELEEMRGKSSNSVPDSLGQKTEETDSKIDFKAIWDGNEKVFDVEKIQQIDSVNFGLKEGAQDSSTRNPRLRGGEVATPSTTIENGTAMLFLVVGAAIAKFVTGKFKPTKTPKPKKGEKVEEEDLYKKL